jgi:hypothetical protein
MAAPAPRAPYGFRVGQDEALEPVPEQAAAVRRVRELRAAGANLRAIRAALERELGERVGLDALSRLLRLVKEAPSPPDPFLEALKAYRERFGDVPAIMGIPSARYPEIEAEMRRALEDGVPRTDNDFRRVLDYRELPPGAEI